MKWRDLFFLVRRNLLRMKMRVVMTATGVLIGTAAIVLVVSLGIGLQNANAESMSGYGELTELEIYSPRAFGGPAGSMPEAPVLDEDALNEFRKLPGVMAVTPLVNAYGGMLSWKRLETGANIIGIDPKEAERLNLKTESGTPRLGQYQVVVGAKIAENFMDPRTGRPPAEKPSLQGQTLTLTLSKVDSESKIVERNLRLRVTGVLKSSGGSKDYSMYLAMKDVVEINTWTSGASVNYDRDGYPQALVKVEDAQQTLAVERAISAQGFYVYSLQSMLQSSNILFMIIQAVLGGLGGVALLVAGFGIANAMIMAIYERTREIGLMKAVGARNRDVLFVFLTEAGCIGLLGGLAGLLVGLAGGALLNFVAQSYIASMAAQQGAVDANIPSLVQTPPWLILFALGFSALIGVASGIYPALRATRLDPIAALRYE